MDIGDETDAESLVCRRQTRYRNVSFDKLQAVTFVSGAVRNRADGDPDAGGHHCAERVTSRHTASFSAIEKSSKFIPVAVARCGVQS
jgi:hypothetical protein